MQIHMHGMPSRFGRVVETHSKGQARRPYSWYARTCNCVARLSQTRVQGRCKARGLCGEAARLTPNGPLN